MTADQQHNETFEIHLSANNPESETQTHLHRRSSAQLSKQTVCGMVVALTLKW